MAIPSDPQTPTTLNIPSILAFAVLSFFAIRYFFFSPASPAAPGAGAASARGRAVDPRRIDTVMQMFPQLSRRDVEWDLLRNGGSVQATTDKVLREGRLDVPPPNFRAQDPPAAAGAAGGAGSTRRPGAPAQQKPIFTDLITRYKLTSRVNTPPPATTEGEATEEKGKERPKATWSANKVERQAALQRRREEMVLAARRKMEERDRAGKS